jgi:uncharacterized protein
VLRTTLIHFVAAIAIPLALEAQSGIERFIPPSPTPAGFIHDGGPVLNAAALAQLNARITSHQAGGRGDIGVAILRDIGDYPPYEIGTEIYRAWKIGSVAEIGSERRDLGALLLIVPKELSPNGKGQCWITTGLGAEGLITDNTAGTICREAIIPHLQARDYAAAIAAGIDGIAAELAEVNVEQPSGARADTGGPSAGLTGGLVGLAALVGSGGGLVAWRRHKRRKPRLCPQGHGKMRLLDEKADDAVLRVGQAKEEAVKSVDYDVWACDECGEKIILRYKRWFTSYTECPSCTFWTAKSKTRTLVKATTSSGGMAETTRTCQHCGWSETKQHATPRISSSSSSSSGGGSSSRGSSFGGSGRSGGGGGGSSY